jgi:F-type H+-transporting ATPase subunit gamma
MANIKDLKVRIKSTKNTFKITSAMKLVSAAKLSRAQSKIMGLSHTLMN